MRAIYFIEKKDGVKFYKCDTFWSKSDKIKHAKIHNDSENDQKRFFESLLGGFKPYKVVKTEGPVEWSDEDFERVKTFEGGLYGFQTILDTETEENKWTLPEDAKISDPIYLTEIISISKLGIVESPTFESYRRNNKIEQIIK